MTKEPVVRTLLVMLLLMSLAGCHGAGDVDAPAPVSHAERARTQSLKAADAQQVPDANATEAEANGEMLTMLEFPNAVEALPGVWGSGQPTREQFSAAAETGVRTVINLRVMTEAGAWDEREFVEGLGMRYVHIPIAGTDGITTGSAGVLSRFIDDARNRPVLVHCRDGRNAGALIEMSQTDDDSP